jgi:hypothetical protein
MEIAKLQTSFESENLISTDQIQNIYSKLCVQDDLSFDLKEENEFIQQCIEECFDTNLKQISTKNLQENIELLNTAFVQLVKYCFSKKFRKISIIFIGFVDYFALDYNKTYNSFHEKLQKLIINACQCLIGKTSYQKYVKKTNQGVFIVTLFDLYQKNK